MITIWIPPHVARERKRARRFTAEELVALAAERGFHTTTSQLYEWIRLGLMGKAAASERGRWPPQQADLWLKLLEERQRPKVHIADLCNVPVGGWLFFGETIAGVGLSQVQTAMQTWADKQLHPRSLEVIRRTVQELVRLTKTKDAQLIHQAKRRLNEEFTRARVNYDAVRDPLVCLMEGRKPEKRGQMKGPRGAGFSAELLLDLWQTRERALRHMASFDTWMWEWARAAMLRGVHDYMLEFPRLSREAQQFPELKRMFQPETLSTLVSSSCLNLATLLQIAFEEAHKNPPCPEIPGLQEPLQLRAWREGARQAEVMSRPVVNTFGQLLSIELFVRIDRLDNPV